MAALQETIVPIGADATFAGTGGSLEFSTRVSVEARRLRERDAKLGGCGRRQGWAWHTARAYEQFARQPHDGYCNYLRGKTSAQWSEKDTARLEKMPWGQGR